MMKHIIYSSVLGLLLCTTAQANTDLTIETEGFTKNGFINPDYAFCVRLAKGETPPPGLRLIKKGPNKSPAMRWSAGPEGTKSYAIIAITPDVPVDRSASGQVGKTIPDGVPRRDGYNWVLVNIPASITSITEGEESANTTEPIIRMTQHGLRGQNSYTNHTPLPSMTKQIHVGYDGPCPAPNDERVHEYHFKVFALDVEKLTLSDNFDGKEAMSAISGHILASGEVVAKYTLNDSLAAKP